MPILQIKIERNVNNVMPSGKKEDKDLHMHRRTEADISSANSHMELLATH